MRIVCVECSWIIRDDDCGKFYGHNEKCSKYVALNECRCKVGILLGEFGGETLLTALAHELLNKQPDGKDGCDASGMGTVGRILENLALLEW